MKTKKELATDFLRMIIAGKIREAFETRVASDFRHHNAYSKGDAESLMKSMEGNEALFPGKTFEIKHALEDGDLVATHSHVQLKPGTDLVIVHLMRFAGDRIAEMWDVAQPFPTESKNQNGPF